MFLPCGLSRSNALEDSVKLRLFFLVLLLPALLAPAEVTLPKLLASHMVVQRNLPVHVWGKAQPGEEVTVGFRGENRAVKADELGKWSVYLAPGEAGGPFQLTVQGRKSDGSAQIITLDDILVGDLWLASGQSNMEFDLRNAATAAQDVPAASNDRIRLLVVEKHTSDYELNDAPNGGWKAATPDSAKYFSAIAWYFAREIQSKEHVPVGVIDATWGGTVAESWVRLEAIGEDAALMPLFVSRGKMTAREADSAVEQAWEKKQIEEAKAAGKTVPSFPWHAPLNTWAPSLIYNGMIAPLTPLPIRGVIWYQGESNSAVERAPLYHRIFRTLIEDWRHQWAEGDFPFLFVQIANFKSSPAEDWATLREEQRKTLELRNTAMAVTIDIGNPNDVHPTNKLDPGLRLARAARALSYGEQLEYSGPLFRQAVPVNGAMRLYFDHAKTLKVKGSELTGFEVAGKDGNFLPATAKVEGGTVLVSSPEVPNPAFVRYGWSNSPQCNLYNGDDLPASPFTSR